jgi:Flp pilus assembly protein TadD
MNELQFTLAESLKALALLFLALIASRVAAATRIRSLSVAGRALTAALAIWAARGLGVEISAGTHNFAAASELERQEPARAYANALRAAELKPGTLSYWESLEQSKVALRQFNSALQDEPVLTGLAGGELDESDALFYAWCHYDVGDYEQALARTRRLIRKNPYFAAPYTLQGHAYVAEKNYEQAKQSYLTVLQMFPNDAAAVEGLAHVYYLSGNAAGAEEVLRQTGKYSFPAEARRRFEDLKRLYAQ